MPRRLSHLEEAAVRTTKSNQALRDLYVKGKRFLEVAEKRKSRGKGVRGAMSDLNAETQAKRNRLMEARHFAQLYDGDELNWLCSLGQSQGRPLTRIDVLQLIRIKDRRKRNALAKKCADEAWTARRLEFEVRRIIPRRRYGGRRQDPPRSIEQALLVTERMAASWIRWISVLEPESANTKVNLDDLPTSIREPLRSIEDDAKQLNVRIRQWFGRESRKKNARR
jgi:hypothetical protein